jgi:hypothetical protein
MKRITVPLFKQRIHFTDDPSEAMQLVEKNSIDLASGEYEGFAAQSGGNVYIFAPTVPILAHEAHHAAHMILDHIGDESRDEEVMSYLIEFIVEKCSA